MDLTPVDLTPGERAVLAQIRGLGAGAAGHVLPVRAVMASWPPLHYEAYRNAFGKLFAKALIQLSSDKQAFRLTNTGLAALGMAR